MSNEKIAKSRIGLQKQANNGQMMTIIQYVNAKQIVVQFEDGTIKEARYDDFKRGEIANPNFYATRIGTQKVANNGQLMTVIGYENYEHVVIEFEDGTKRETTWANFCNGEVSNPNFFNTRIGETKTATNGQTMTIVEYQDYDHIVVQFEDGTKKEASYAKFLKGSVANPSYAPHQDHLGNQFRSLQDMAKYWNISYMCLFHRLSRNWSVEEALTIPKKMSLGEFRVRKVLDDNKIEYVYNCTIKQLFQLLNAENQFELFMSKYQDALKQNDLNISRKRLAMFKYDFALTKSQNISALIEVDGEQHFKFVAIFFKTLETFFDRVDSDDAKNAFAEVNRIPLLRIRYDQLETSSIQYMIHDLQTHPDKYLTQHNTFLTEEEYWQPLIAEIENCNMETLETA